MPLTVCVQALGESGAVPEEEEIDIEQLCESDYLSHHIPLSCSL